MSSRVLSYETPVPTSRLAVVAFALSLAAVPMFFLVVPSVITLCLAIIAMRRVSSTLDTRGQRYALSAVRISSYTFLGVLLLFIVRPSLGGRGLSNRSVCAANMKGIIQTLNVYASDWNDAFPAVPYAPYSPGLNDARAMPTSPDANATLRTYYNAPYHQAGSPQAILWQLVLRGDITPKTLICARDPSKSTTPAAITAPTGEFFDNVQDGRQFSFSIAYPWKADGTVGKWWRLTVDDTLPLMADVTPEQGTGTPATDVTARTLTKAANSGNHQRDGQNVAFADNHVEFTRSPDCGQAHDNIFSTSGLPSTGPAQYGGIPASRFSPQLTADKPPFDILMLPVRNESTGRF